MNYSEIVDGVRNPIRNQETPMELFEISKQMEYKIKALEKGRQIISERGDEKSIAISNYEKAITLTMLKLKNGKLTEFEGEEISSVPATIMEKVARGICWEEKLEMEKAEAYYKSAVVGMQSIMAELNALQSINRYLDKT